MLTLADSGALMTGSTSMIDWIIVGAIIIALGLVIYFSYLAK